MPDQIAAYCDDRIDTFGAHACPPPTRAAEGMTDLPHAIQQALRAWKGPAMGDDRSVSALVGRVSDGDQEAWDELIERYSPLVWSICQRFPLSRQDVDDVGQSVWLLLVENIGSLREAAALPGWLATTTRREALRVLKMTQRHDHADLPPDGQMPVDPGSGTIEDELIVAERNAALRAAFAELQPSCHELLSMLLADPPIPYADISARLSIPVGSIGPTRGRCLGQLRRSPHLAGIIGDEAPHANVSGGGR
jgi:RNA polymerase sigma factor (sigma-70 family)